MININEKNNKKHKSHFVFGSLFIIVGIFLFGFTTFQKTVLHVVEEKKIDDFFQNTLEDQNIEFSDNKKSTFIAVLEIPTINLRKGLYDSSSKSNSVSVGIEILKESDMPDISGGILALASHSGTSVISYFKNLENLEKKDLVYIYYNEHKYIYEIYDKLYQEKNGTIQVNKKNNDDSLLVLTTCSKEKEGYQLILLGKKIEIANY